MGNTERIEQQAEIYWDSVQYDDIHKIANPLDYTTDDLDGLPYSRLPDAVKGRLRELSETTV